MLHSCVQKLKLHFHFQLIKQTFNNPLHCLSCLSQSLSFGKSLEKLLAYNLTICIASFARGSTDVGKFLEFCH